MYLTPAQVESLADAMTEVGPRYRSLVWLGCYGGPRIGELLALRWTDLDTMGRTVTISRKSSRYRASAWWRAPPRRRRAGAP